MWRDYELSRGNTSVVFLWKTRSHKLSTSSSHTQDAVVATDHNAVPCTITIFLVFIPSRSAGGLIIPLGLAPWLAHINLSWPHSSETGHICYCEWQSWNLSLPPPQWVGDMPWWIYVFGAARWQRLSVVSEYGETFDPFSVSAALSQAGKCPIVSLWCCVWVYELCRTDCVCVCGVQSLSSIWFLLLFCLLNLITLEFSFAWMASKASLSVLHIQWAPI